MLTLLKNAQVYSPHPLGVCDILVAGTQIAAMAPHLEPPPSSWGGEIVDLHGQCVVPGLVDVHAHLSGGGGEGGAHTRVPPVHLSSFTRAGVTTAIGLLGTDATTRSLAELLAAARGLAHHGLTTFCYTGSYEVPPPTLTGSVRGDIVHIDRVVAVGELAVSDHRSSQPTFDELARIAADAHVAGMMTGKAGLVHLHLGDGPRGLELVRRVLSETELPTRVLHPTHLNRNHDLWAEALQLAGDIDLWADVTAFPPDDHGPSAAQAVAQWLAEGRNPARITASSDGGGCLPEFDADGNLRAMEVGSPDGLLQLIRDLRDDGVPLETAIAVITSNPATLFRLAGKGRLEIGADADILVLNSEFHTQHLLAGGRWMIRDGRPTVLSLFEP
jgi:beta-aspartyl-dipeptidase (metallo-type)